MRIRSVILALGLVLGLALAGQAQFLGNVSPQGVSVTLASAVACTGGFQLYTTGITPNFANLGQTWHQITLVETAGNPNLGGLQAYILGSTDGVTFVQISDTMTQTSNSVNGAGFFARIQVAVKCTNGSYTLFYSGSSASPPQTFGTSMFQLADKNIAVLQLTNANFTSPITFAPFANSAGYLIFSYAGGAGPAGGTLTANCVTPASVPGSISFGPFPLSTTTAPQMFPLPAGPCGTFTATYTSGGAGAGTFGLDWVFNVAGFSSGIYHGQNITTNTNTQLKTGSGYLHSLTINTPGTTEVLTLFDNSSCAGAKVATIAATATSPTYLFDTYFAVGLCVTTAGGAAGDFTVSFQ